MKVVSILQMAHGAAMCIFAIVQLVQQSLQMYCMTKQWQPPLSLRIELMVTLHHSIFVFSLISELGAAGNIPQEDDKQTWWESSNMCPSIPWPLDSGVVCA